ncbi:MAG: ATP phosphoribosyltransferase [Bacilli bacterium]|nr:ATP phosphoribosyltransferase [Bacilli bacterium]
MEKTIIGISKGRIAKAYIDYLYKNNIINLKPEDSRKLYLETEEYIFTFLKPNDIFNCLKNEIIDIGIIGSDVYYNACEEKVTYLSELDLFNCKFALAAPKDTNVEDIKRIAVCSRYAAYQYYSEKEPERYKYLQSVYNDPVMIKFYFSQFFNDVNYVVMDGSLELAPLLGYADAIVDIVETGATLKANNLEIKKTYKPITTMIVSLKGRQNCGYIEEFVRVNQRIRQ